MRQNSHSPQRDRTNADVFQTLRLVPCSKLVKFNKITMIINQALTAISNTIAHIRELQKVVKWLKSLITEKKQQNFLCSRNKINRWKIGNLEREEIVQETYYPPK